MFKVGQLVVQISGDKFCWISHGQVLCIVTKTEPFMVLAVAAQAHWCTDANPRTANENDWELCSYDEFVQNNNAHINVRNGYTAKELSEIKNNGEIKEEKKMELRMDKEKIGSYVLSEEERTTLRDEMTDLLVKYDYNPSSVGVNKIIDEWIKNKGWMINLFKQHPNYNGKFQIAFDTDYPRCTNRQLIADFGYWLENKAYDLKTECKIGAFSYKEVNRIVDKMYYIVDYMSSIKRNGYYPQANGKTLDEIEKERVEWVKRLDIYYQAELQGKVKLYDGNSYDMKLWNYYINMRKFAQKLRNNTEHIATEEFTSMVNGYFPEAKAVAGQKVSRIVNKICTFTGISKDPDYNREYAKYSDALNPLSIKRHTILSCHPIDYLTMSFGNSWASCHTIDKQNKRGMPNDYSGCYSSGTMSYMLDGTSFVFYTVDKSYDGNEYELQDKINRNMFHMGEDKLVQARVYPQATDGETGIYKQIREIAHKVIADCLGVPNLWKNIKGISECNNVICSKGTHYKDYINFDDCNVSYLKDETENLNRKLITVGHTPICPNCGRNHDHQEAVECRSCYEECYEIECADCGCYHSREDMHEIDGEWYCEDCCFFCEYHDEWERGDDDDSVYVEGYGRVCEYALENSDDFYTCDRCGLTLYKGNYRGEDYIETEDDKIFCCSTCAERAGYTSIDSGEWFPESEVYYCEHCETYVHEDDWNGELACCTECVAEVEAEKAEEREAV